MKIKRKILKIITPMLLMLSLAIPLTANASMNGIDVSSWQTGINTRTINADFVICKATEGTGYVNPDCDRAYQQAKASGKEVGVYHFATGSGAIAEADYFVDNIQGYIGEAVLALDWEAGAVFQGPGYAKAFLDRVYQRTGVKPMIYMSNSTIHAYDWSAVVAADYGLWNAGYYAGYTPFYGYNPDAPLIGGTGPWEFAAMYQYTSSGYLSGWSGALDLNVFYGDKAAWDAYATAGGKVDTDPAPAPSIPQIAVDESCGPATVARWQEVMGTTVDGVISGQIIPNCTTYWRPNLNSVNYGGQGSELIRAVQTQLTNEGHYHGAIDGLLGPATIRGIQAHYGLTQDASFGPATVRALQTALNQGRF